MQPFAYSQSLPGRIRRRLWIRSTAAVNLQNSVTCMREGNGELRNSSWSRAGGSRITKRQDDFNAKVNQER
jgi:hypothetical protein